MGEDDARQTLRAIVSWGRYAEAFALDQEAGVFSLEDPR
jgi:NitT/TauT family transport system ATP-binding protein